MPRTQTITSVRGGGMGGGIPKPYISFEAVVGRNSEFEELTREQLEELGGVEYRGLTALLWIVGGVRGFFVCLLARPLVGTHARRWYCSIISCRN